MEVLECHLQQPLTRSVEIRQTEGYTNSRKLAKKSGKVKKTKFRMALNFTKFRTDLNFTKFRTELNFTKFRTDLNFTKLRTNLNFTKFKQI